mmetsp:Transcript_7174/g.22642  ORF Transcript_7174/g.22642 Transcript_7174/m.22642 type:complete len:260 (+) Transcript_7174:1962-2741(+)
MKVRILRRPHRRLCRVVTPARMLRCHGCHGRPDHVRAGKNGCASSAPPPMYAPTAAPMSASCRRPIRSAQLLPVSASRTCAPNGSAPNCRSMRARHTRSALAFASAQRAIVTTGKSAYSRSSDEAMATGTEPSASTSHSRCVSTPWPLGAATNAWSPIARHIAERAPWKKVAMPAGGCSAAHASRRSCRHLNGASSRSGRARSCGSVAASASISACCSHAGWRLRGGSFSARVCRSRPIGIGLTLRASGESAASCEQPE